MSISPEELFRKLDALEIQYDTVEHDALFTVAQSRELRGQIDGGHTKNLFLKDKKDNYFLLTLEEEAQVDLKKVHQQIGAASRVSFGKPEAMEEFLGVTPGAVTAFGLVNDDGLKVRFFLDETLLSFEKINCHPLVNTATTSITPSDLVRFIETTGHEVHILKTADTIAN